MNRDPGMRGASWSSQSRFFRCSYRNYAHLLFYTDDNTGFRIAKHGDRFRVLRGCTSRNFRIDMRCTARGVNKPSGGFEAYGLRIARRKK